MPEDWESNKQEGQASLDCFVASFPGAKSKIRHHRGNDAAPVYKMRIIFYKPMTVTRGLG